MDNTQCSQQSRLILIWHLFSCVLFLICKCTMTLRVLVTLKKNCVLYVGKYRTLAACLVCTWDSIMSHHITFCIHYCLTDLQLLKKKIITTWPIYQFRIIQYRIKCSKCFLLLLNRFCSHLSQDTMCFYEKNNSVFIVWGTMAVHDNNKMKHMNTLI